MEGREGVGEDGKEEKMGRHECGKWPRYRQMTKKTHTHGFREAFAKSPIAQAVILKPNSSWPMTAAEW